MIFTNKTWYKEKSISYALIHFPNNLGETLIIGLQFCFSSIVDMYCKTKNKKILRIYSFKFANEQIIMKKSPSVVSHSVWFDGIKQ